MSLAGESRPYKRPSRVRGRTRGTRRWVPLAPPVFSALGATGSASVLRAGCHWLRQCSPSIRTGEASGTQIKTSRQCHPAGASGTQIKTSRQCHPAEASGTQIKTSRQCHPAAAGCHWLRQCSPCWVPLAPPVFSVNPHWRSQWHPDQNLSPVPPRREPRNRGRDRVSAFSASRGRPKTGSRWVFGRPCGAERGSAHRSPLQGLTPLATRGRPSGAFRIASQTGARELHRHQRTVAQQASAQSRLRTPGDAHLVGDPHRDASWPSARKTPPPGRTSSAGISSMGVSAGSKPRARTAARTFKGSGSPAKIRVPSGSRPHAARHTGPARQPGTDCDWR